MVENNRWAVDREELKRIPIGNGSGPDKIIWHYITNRNYTVKSGYFLAHKGLNRMWISPGLRKLWRLRFPNKIKIHLWRILFVALSVRTNLIRRGIVAESMCPRCNSRPEDILQAFWSCLHVRRLWKQSQLCPVIISFGRGSFGFILSYCRTGSS